MKKNKNILFRIRRLVTFFIIILVLSGISAIPITLGMDLLIDIINALPIQVELFIWIKEVQLGIIKSYQIAPYLAYGTDWLAFAHFVIAILFIGVYQNPIRNQWIIKFGLTTCILIVPMALIAGHFRQIPLSWRLIDCSFGIFGFIILYYCLMLTKKLENIKNVNNYRV